MLMRRDGTLSRGGKLLRTFVGFTVLVLAFVLAPRAAAESTDGDSASPGSPSHASAFAGRADDSAEVYATHTVASGETLWQIATEAAPEGTDPQLAVRAIMEFNGLDSSVIRAGQQISLPPLG